MTLIMVKTARVKKLFSKLIFSTGILLASYNYLVNIVGGLPSKPIKTFSELERVIEEEKIRLGIGEHTDIGICFSDKRPYARRIRDNDYEINLGLPEDLDFKAVRHELYHVAAGHADQDPKSFLESLKYFLIYEPKAIIYQATGIRL